MIAANDAGSRRYFLDENVARSVASALRSAGREVLESRDTVGPQAADIVLEYVAATQDLVLVSHDRHFRSIIKGKKERGLRKTAPTIWVGVEEVFAATRLYGCLYMIEEIITHAEGVGFDLEYIKLSQDEVSVKYRHPAPCLVISGDGATTSSTPPAFPASSPPCSPTDALEMLL